MTVQNLMMELQKEQEILLNMSDIMSEIYLCESAILRCQKLAAVKGEDFVKDRVAITKVYINDAMERVAIHSKNVAAAWAEGDSLKMLMMAIKRFTKHEFINTKTLRRQIAETLTKSGNFCFND
jgi:hypothetical protein